MVEAAGIEPSLEADTIAALLAQKVHTNGTPETACEDLIDTYHTLSDQNRNPFLQLVCAIYVQWSLLTHSIQSMIGTWTSLLEEIKEDIERIAERLQVADEPERADGTLL
jgi:hypothetical protein